MDIIRDLLKANQVKHAVEYFIVNDAFYVEPFVDYLDEHENISLEDLSDLAALFACRCPGPYNKTCYRIKQILKSRSSGLENRKN
jgi:hypothetical protein